MSTEKIKSKEIIRGECSDIINFRTIEVTDKNGKIKNIYFCFGVLRQC